VGYPQTNRKIDTGKTLTRWPVFVDHFIQKAYYSLSSIGSRFNAAVKRAGIRRRNPYHTRHTFACWLLSAGANPSFIASQMGHENAQMVYEVYGAWIEEMNGEQVLMLNDKLAR